MKIKSLNGKQAIYATTNQSTKIITYLSRIDKPVTASTIYTNCMLSRQMSSASALNWLVCNRLIFKHKTRSRSIWVYSINPAFVEMRGVKR